MKVDTSRGTCQHLRMDTFKNVRTTRQISEACGVTREAVRLWREMGAPCFQNGAGFMFDVPELAAWLDERLPKRAQMLRDAERRQEAI